MTQRNGARISLAEVAERLGESQSCTYYRAQQTGYVYPGVEAKRLPGVKRWFVSRAEFEAALSGPKTPAANELAHDWFDR
jgi:hypothetical protein